MSISDEQIEFALDLFRRVGPLSTRKMMGGLCIYSGGTIFAIIRSDGAILLKGAGDFARWMTAEGWAHWAYVRDNGRTGTMPYWELPEDLLDNPEEASALASRALEYL